MYWGLGGGERWTHCLWPHPRSIQTECCKNKAPQPLTHILESDWERERERETWWILAWMLEKRNGLIIFFKNKNQHCQDPKAICSTACRNTYRPQTTINTTTNKNKYNALQGFTCKAQGSEKWVSVSVSPAFCQNVSACWSFLTYSTCRIGSDSSVREITLIGCSGKR